EVLLLDISESGARIEHRERINLGAQSSLQVINPLNGDDVQIEGCVRWSRLSSDMDAIGQHVYHSAVAFSHMHEDTHQALARLVTACGTHDPGSLDQKRRIINERAHLPRLIRTRDQISADDMKLVLWARKTLQLNSEEALKWYQRARFSEEALAAAGGTVHYKDEVLAVWELLQRRIPVHVIALAFENEG
ncbi:MAG: PilZ domain-containing protein, partial [Acidobacteriota bacterium]